MLNILERVNLDKFLFLDIETRPLTNKFSKKDTPGLYDVVEYMTRYRKEYEGYDSLSDFYKAKASLFPELGAICCVSFGILVKGKLRVKSFYGEDELEILKEVAKFLKKNASWRLCHFSGIGFDEPFIVKRMLANGLTDIPSIIDHSTEKPWEAADRSFDLKDAMRLNMYYTPSLLSLSNMLGLPSPKGGMSGDQVAAAFYDGKIEEIKTYCEGDVLTTCNCLLKLMGKDVVELDNKSIEKKGILDEIYDKGCIEPSDYDKIITIAGQLDDDDKQRLSDILEAATLQDIPPRLIKILKK